MDWLPWLLGGACGAAIWLALALRRRLAEARRDLHARRSQVELLRDEVELRTGRLDRITAVLGGARVGIVLTDGAGAVAAANPAAAEFVGARHGAALAETKLRQLVEAARSSAGRVEEEIDVRNPLPRTLHVAAEPIGDSEWVAAYVDDVTERRKVDAARRDFVANVSHELKTPLGALALLAETLETAVEPEVRRKLIARIGEQASRMTRLVDDILDLSLVEAGGMEPAVVDLHKVLAAAAVGVRDIAGAAAVALEVADGDSEVHVYGDERQLVSAAGNLLANAISATAAAVPPHQVTARAFLRDGDAVIEVADTGIGIAAKHQPRIFERFYRVDAARSRETGGTGLGLAIVRHVALNHGGSVEVESEVGVGSTFRVVLPAGGVETA